MHLDGSKALGVLSYYVFLKFNTQNPIEKYLNDLLSSNSATGRQIGALIITETIKMAQKFSKPTSHLIPESLRVILYNLLSTPQENYYEELVPNLHTLHEETTVLLQSFINIGVNIMAFGINSNQILIFSPPVVQEILFNLYEKFKSVIPTNVSGNIDILAQLDARRNRVANRLQYIENSKYQQQLAVSASLSESFASFGIIPENLDPLVQPLLRSIKLEENIVLQRRTASALALLIAHCTDNPQQSPVDIIFENIVAALNAAPLPAIQQFREEAPKKLKKENVQKRKLKKKKKKKKGRAPV